MRSAYADRFLKDSLLGPPTGRSSVRSLKPEPLFDESSGLAGGLATTRFTIFIRQKFTYEGTPGLWHFLIEAAQQHGASILRL